MSYQEQLYKTSKEAKQFIFNKLDASNEIIFFDDSKGTIGEFADESVFYDLPSQIYIGKYNNSYYYHIIKLYKEDNHYFARGLNEDEGWEYMDFEITDEIDPVTATEIADKLNQIS